MRGQSDTESKTTAELLSRKINNEYYAVYTTRNTFGLLSCVTEAYSSPSSTYDYLLVDTNPVARFYFRIYRQADAEIMALIASMRTRSYSLPEALRRLRSTMSQFNERVILNIQGVNEFAEWLLIEPGSKLATHSTRTRRPPKTHLIGRDLMYALAHAEYLIFMRKDVLKPNLRGRHGSLRDTRRSGGLDDQDPAPMVGYREGIAGYQEAVRYVYGLFNENVDASALEPPPMQSHLSIALRRRTASTEDYVGSQWTHCLQHSRVYIFCPVYVLFFIVH